MFSSALGPLRQNGGFTLVELLVSCVICALMVAFLFQFFNATSGAWHSGTNQNETFSNARAALQMMERDISETTSTSRVKAYPSPTPTLSPVPANPFATPVGGPLPILVIDHYYPAPSPALQPGDEINQELYCLTNVPNDGDSNLCAVGYFCAWMPDLIPTSDPMYAQKYASAPHAYALIRQFLGSGSAKKPGLYDRLVAAQSHNSPLAFIDVYQRGVILLYPSPTPSASPPVATPTELCAYIWDLQFCTPKTLQYTPTSPSPSPTPEYPASPNLSSGKYYPATLPPYIEIRFKALSENAARRLEGNTDVRRDTWNDNTSTSAVYQNIILPGTRQFVARVPIIAVSSTPVPTP